MPLGRKDSLMTTIRKQTQLEAVMPFFIVDNLKAASEFYADQLGFETEIAIPESKPFFAIVRRDRVAIMLKEIGADTRPRPNHTRHEWARWDAYIYSPDPDTLFAEYQERNVKFHRPIADTGDGLRAFEIKDNNGYVL